MQIDSKIPLIFGVPDRSFFKQFRAEKAFVAELRPALEGVKVVAKELLKRGIRPVIICDNMLAFCMKKGLVSETHVFYSGRGKKALTCRTGSFIALLCAKIHNVPYCLHHTKPMLRRATSLTKICGMKVTQGKFKTYVPLVEEVPLTLVGE
jgi:methylthioribose-1-phosphate isomerase